MNHSLTCGRCGAGVPPTEQDCLRCSKAGKARGGRETSYRLEIAAMIIIGLLAFALPVLLVTMGAK